MLKKRYALPENTPEEKPIERIHRLSRVGHGGALYEQFCKAKPSETSDLRERILSGEYFKLTDE